MIDAATEARAHQMLADRGRHASCGTVPYDVAYQLIAVALTADRDRIRGEAFEEAARIAEGTGRPVGMGDGDTYTVGTATQAAAAIRARALAQPSPVDDGWRDIATAPKDGRTILLWGVNLATELVTGYWSHWHDNLADADRQGWREACENVGDVLHGATHWRPLPTPPASTGGEVGK
jgi:hypothetical protein